VPEIRPPTGSPDAEADDQITISTSRPARGQMVITVGGEVDMLTSPQLRRVTLNQLSDGAELVVLELDGVTFLGTSGLAVLIEVREAAHAAGVELRLVCTQRRVMRPLAIAGLVPLFDIHDTLALALAPS
jgi:anti-sigma B factor antagonist